jgi:2-dehydropantoate 2-reductase
MQVPLVDRFDPEDEYDLALVAVRCDQLSSVLPMLAQNRRIPSGLFLGNHPGAAQKMAQALGRERVRRGLSDAGGYREGNVVRYVWPWRFAVPFGGLDNAPGPSVETIARAF